MRCCRLWRWDRRSDASGVFWAGVAMVRLVRGVWYFVCCYGCYFCLFVVVALPNKETENSTTSVLGTITVPLPLISGHKETQTILMALQNHFPVPFFGRFQLASPRTLRPGKSHHLHPGKPHHIHRLQPRKVSPPLLKNVPPQPPPVAQESLTTAAQESSSQPHRKAPPQPPPIAQESIVTAAVPSKKITLEFLLHRALPFLLDVCVGISLPRLP